MNYQSLMDEFNTAFGYAGERVYFSPGRINLIGEHTDYNGGNVFPCALAWGPTAYMLPAMITRFVRIPPTCPMPHRRIFN